MQEPEPAILRVGVTGHRPNKLGPGEARRLASEVGRLMTELRRVLEGASRPARLRVVSPLAEGADRIVARSALRHGAELVVPLPFARDACLVDFSSGPSRQVFRELLDRAREVIELAGECGDEPSRRLAYARVGEAVVARSDVLVAIWDGKAAAGGGGTAEVVDLARRKGCPVLWLPTSGGGGAVNSTTPRLLVGDDTVTTDAAGAFCALAKRIVARQL